jgi:hypothetical protein
MLRLTPKFVCNEEGAVHGNASGPEPLGCVFDFRFVDCEGEVLSRPFLFVVAGSIHRLNNCIASSRRNPLISLIGLSNNSFIWDELITRPLRLAFGESSRLAP